MFVVGKVEEWLLAQETEMQKTNRLITKRALFYYCDKKTRVEWMLDFLVSGNALLCMSGLHLEAKPILLLIN